MTLGGICALLSGAACQITPPDFYGHYWCFVAEGATGYKVGDPTQLSSIHRNGHPVETCFCFCDQLHADSLLFTGEDPPPASTDWLDTMEFNRAFAVQSCRDAALHLGLINDNCDEVMPQFPRWSYQDHECAGGFYENLPYCDAPDRSGDGETSGRSDDTGGLSSVSKREPS